MNGWIVCWLCLQAIGFGVVLVRHGKPRIGKINAWDNVMGLAISFGLLYLGGAF